VPRAKRSVAAHHRHVKLLALASGHKTARHRLFKRAHESLLHAGAYAFAHRRERKGDMRRIWITRINAASRECGMKYGQLIEGLNMAGVTIDRKMLADLAVREPVAFASIVNVAKEAVAKVADAKLAAGKA
jgi:large subunit ribosomal protein L20